MGNKEAPRRRGRPPGSVSLTPEIERTICAYIRAGASMKDAAEAAGISVRTLDDWLARARGSGRPCTPAIRHFAAAVAKSYAEAKVAAEVRGFEKDPWMWLRRMAPSSLQTEESAGSYSGLSDEDLDAELRRVAMVWISDDPLFRMPPCSHPRCRCDWHRDRS